ncbi:hypothetical protein FB563_6967 [Streptomyces puniciscabiei]|uniref:Uncharacterized protein n=1 Tax=Streptomyces puniciscabiei TaxID=164348 RepID=A0A542TJ03_9ACTN|nr:hypothetical protein FB563_6967 [Streptomyces puniciscabiei]
MARFLVLEDGGPGLASVLGLLYGGSPKVAGRGSRSRTAAPAVHLGPIVPGTAAPALAQVLASGTGARAVAAGPWAAGPWPCPRPGPSVCGYGGPSCRAERRSWGRQPQPRGPGPGDGGLSPGSRSRDGGLSPGPRSPGRRSWPQRALVSQRRPQRQPAPGPVSGRQPQPSCLVPSPGTAAPAPGSRSRDGGPSPGPPVSGTAVLAAKGPGLATAASAPTQPGPRSRDGIPSRPARPPVRGRGPRLAAGGLPTLDGGPRAKRPSHNGGRVTAVRRLD